MNCKICGRKCESEYCFYHKPRKPLRAYKSRKKKTIIKMSLFFLGLWMKRRHVSEVSGKVLLSPPSSTYFHHILPKYKYPDAAFDEENIILLTTDEHANVEIDMYRYEEVNKRREKLLIKHKKI